MKMKKEMKKSIELMEIIDLSKNHVRCSSCDFFICQLKNEYGMCMIKKRRRHKNQTCNKHSALTR